MEDLENYRSYHDVNGNFRNLTFKNTNNSHGNSGLNNRDNFGSGRNEEITRRHENRNCVEIRVPSDCLGKIIGKGGANIKDLQREMSVRVFINKESVDEDDEVAVEISGSDGSNVEETKERLLEIVNKANRFHNNNQRNNNSNRGRNNFDDDESPSRNGFRKKTESTPSIPAFQKEVKVRVDWGKAKLDHLKHQENQLANYGPIEKNFYMEDSEITSMTDEQVELLREQNQNISVESLAGLKSYSWFREEDGDEEERKRMAKQDHINRPVFTFAHAFKAYPEIMAEIQRNGFKQPSPIQMQAWPVIMAGRDLIGIAQTGTGKTLAFLLPAFIHIDGQMVPRNERKGPTVLVLTPTRELAQQIEQEVKKYKYKQMKCVCVYGGGSRREQVGMLRRGAEMVVATPGRLTDLIDTKDLSLESVSYLVLDEADRMLDLGFEPAIRRILMDIRIDRQTIMTSATWPPGVRKLACAYQKNPIQVNVGSLDLAAVHSVEQRVVMVQEEEKFEQLKFLLHELEEDAKVLVFMGRKATVDHISSELALEGRFSCQSIHGGHEQDDRERALDDLKTGRVRILIATDVASRGIDIKDLTHVVNYDFPKNIEEYVHRVGRTGRAGQTGIATSFLARGDWGSAQKLIDILSEADQYIPPELTHMAERFRSKRETRTPRDGGGYNSGMGGGRGGRGRGGFRGRNNFETFEDFI